MKQLATDPSQLGDHPVLSLVPDNAVAPPCGRAANPCFPPVPPFSTCLLPVLSITRRKMSTLQLHLSFADHIHEISKSEIILGQHLGSGCSGHVYAGAYNGQPVAIKQFICKNESNLPSILHELEILALMGPSQRPRTLRIRSGQARHLGDHRTGEVRFVAIARTVDVRWSERDHSSL